VIAHDHVTLALPVSSRWDFGGHPYGLEPLTLPMRAPEPADTFDGWNLPLDEDLESSRQSLLTLDASAEAATLPPPDPVDRVFWFRWITGHQTTFVLWQLLARASAASAHGDPAVATAGQASSRILVRGYSAMLLYAGSCPRSVYHRVIRPSMALHHPGFSGSWARDSWPARSLLSGRAAPDTPLGRECELNRIVHEGIAGKLVPDAPSLLQVAAGQRLSWRRSTLAVLYDTYFLTLRAQVPYQAVVLQLMRRLHAIVRDLAANGLYPPYASSAAERPPGLLSQAVAECERTIPETLFALAAEATAGGLHGWADR
jgi:L-tyrosine peroxygenase